MNIPKYTFGIGDRFGHQAKAQLQAVLTAREQGIDVFPVWNKSHREHALIHSSPDSVRGEADAAVAALGFAGPYFVDADHIGLATVDAFLDSSDFFTIDVADCTGKPAERDAVEAFLVRMRPYTGPLFVPGVDRPLELSRSIMEETAGKFLLAVQEAGRIYRRIEKLKGRDRFVTEVSVDETDAPQNPAELFLILAMIAAEGIPAQTVAPKFTGRFNKGVDYAGDLVAFAREFSEDLRVVAFAAAELGLPASLKLSVHSGSDKFSIYPIIRRLLVEQDAGLHVKTAGTTWLEEVIGLAESGGEGLVLAKEIYAEAYAHRPELVAPYTTVTAIDPDRLPTVKTVLGWSSRQFAAAVRHVETEPAYNPHVRQLLHVAFKVAAGLGQRFTDALKANAKIVGHNVTMNLLERHLLPLFGRELDRRS